MTIEPCTVVCNGQGPWLPGRGRLRVIHNEDNRMTPCQAYQKALNQTKADVIVMIHDDVRVYDANWLDRISTVFLNNPDCVAVGLGGALALGNRDIYRKRYLINNLARIGYMSNADDWQIHGSREGGNRRVAVIEQLCIAVRVGWLRDRGGWPVDNIRHHGIDMWLACEAARDLKELWMCGIKFVHYGGATSVSPKYSAAPWLPNGSLAWDHQEPHIFLHQTYRDCLPIEVF